MHARAIHFDDCPFVLGEIPSDFLEDNLQEADGDSSDGESDGVETRNPEPETRNTDFQLAEWQRRQEIVRTCLALRVGERGGVSQKEVSRQLGEPGPNICRYLRAYREAEAAQPGAGFEALKPGISTGRPTKFALTPDETKALRQEVLTRNSMTLAIEWFPKNPACAPHTARLIFEELDKAARAKRPACWPISLKRAAYVSAEERAQFRGKKAFQTLEHCDRKGAWWLDETGAKIFMAPNTLWESDDMSINEPFRFTCPETGALRMGRQSLNTIDVFSAFWVAGQPLGRPRDAYRVEDIADHMLGCCEAHGLPLHWRLERGVWENDFVKGIKVATNPEGPDKRWGGLSALFRVHFTWKSRGKGTIESSFNLLQNLMAHASPSIGRVRGEFERGTQLFLRAQQGDPEAAAHFWDIASAADGLVAAMIAFNHRPKKRRAHGRELVVPADQFYGPSGSGPAPRREIPAGERWRFCPIKREATVRQGHIECVVDHYPLPFRFAVNGAEGGVYVQHAHRVLIAFHPGRPEEGCHVFNAEDRNERNRDGWKFGEKICCAPMAFDAPQLALSPDEQAHARRKNAAASVRTEFRAPTKYGKATARTESRDGFGNRTESGSASRSAMGSACAPHAGSSGAPPEPPRHRASRPAEPSEEDFDAERARLDALDAAELAEGRLILS